MGTRKAPRAGRARGPQRLALIRRQRDRVRDVALLIEDMTTEELTELLRRLAEQRRRLRRP